MSKVSLPHVGNDDELLAELAAAAYRVTLSHGFKGAFIDVELDLWRALQTAHRQVSSATQERLCAV